MFLCFGFVSLNSFFPKRSRGCEDADAVTKRERKKGGSFSSFFSLSVFFGFGSCRRLFARLSMFCSFGT